MRTIDFCDGRVDHPALVFLRQSFVWCEDDSHRHQVVDILEWDTFVFHFFVDGIDGLDTCFHCELVSHGFEFVLDRL